MCPVSGIERFPAHFSRYCQFAGAIKLSFHSARAGFHHSCCRRRLGPWREEARAWTSPVRSELAGKLRRRQVPRWPATRRDHHTCRPTGLRRSPALPRGARVTVKRRARPVMPGGACPRGQRQHGRQVRRQFLGAAECEGVAVSAEQPERLPADGLLVWVRLGTVACRAASPAARAPTAGRSGGPYSRSSVPAGIAGAGEGWPDLDNLGAGPFRAVPGCRAAG